MKHVPIFHRFGEEFQNWFSYFIPGSLHVNLHAQTDVCFSSCSEWLIASYQFIEWLQMITLAMFLRAIRHQARPIEFIRKKTSLISTPVLMPENQFFRNSTIFAFCIDDRSMQPMCIDLSDWGWLMLELQQYRSRLKGVTTVHSVRKSIKIIK